MVICSFINTKGLGARPHRKTWLFTYVTDNHNEALLCAGLCDKFKAVPGAGFRRHKQMAGYFLDARGYITFNAAKYIDFQSDSTKYFG
jgi:hypothetical protein